MAQWSDTTKHLPAEFNSGNKYTVNDQMSIEALNGNIENSLYAVRLSENARAATDNGVSYNSQTASEQEKLQARINISAINSDDANNIVRNNNSVIFAESERQKSKNLIDNAKLIADWSKPFVVAVKPNTTYGWYASTPNAAGIYCWIEERDVNKTIISGTGKNKWQMRGLVTTTSTTAYLSFATITDKEHFMICEVSSIDEIGDWQEYNGQIVHEKGTLVTPDLTDTNPHTQNGVAHIVETFLSSDKLTWYRIWSDGWKECGTFITLSGGYDANKEVRLPISFSTTNYTVMRTNHTSDNSTTLTWRALGFNSKTKNTVYVAISDKASDVYLYCCGY